ncbi:MAG TPA: efflux RND transporter periplasmic adaptor subunit [Chthonomonadaceae bacterium]|nr:efflux RND transporter periplasmic adaptor subunit [Chthonomonadaceae bacterium]
MPQPPAPSQGEGEEGQERGRRPRRWRRWIGLLAAVLLIVAVTVWWTGRPLSVQVARPELRTYQETLAASGRVAGRRESAVGAQGQGIVAELWVQKGDTVRQGDALARVQDSVAVSQAQQAAQAVQTARTQLAQALLTARPSERDAALARVNQARSAVTAQATQVERAQAAVRQAEALVQERAVEILRAQSAESQADAQQGLTRKTLDRSAYLYKEGAIASQALDQAEEEEKVATAARATARQDVLIAQANLEAARAALLAARHDVSASQANLDSTRAALAASQAEQRTVDAPPRRENVEAARQRVRESEAALQVAREQVQTFVVQAPFAGTVTEILAEKGAPAGPGGILRLVQTGRPEIHLDVDETNLADLHTGQRAVITSSAYRTAHFEGRITQVGPKVDPARGTVEVTVALPNPPDWLHPGQTVNVNIVLAEAARRLLLPITAVRVMGDRRAVLLVRDGRAVEQTVVTGPVEGDRVPILEGLSPQDTVVGDAMSVAPGSRVRVVAGRR